jgi:SAM-dependent methyltransferase
VSSISPELPDLRPLRPECYVVRHRLWSGDDFLAFHAREPEDFDWLEAMILRHGYYEHEGIWCLDVDRDKRAMAEIVAAFAPSRALELGCSNGAVLRCLAELGVSAEGVEISRMAIGRAFPEIRDRIHHGDLLTLPLRDGFDIVFGLDVFEHLNPNRLAEYLGRIFALLRPGGFLYACLPAFADDPVFGTVFPVYLRDWFEDVWQGRPFRLLHADGKGYPLNGHLIWAHSEWWVRQFEDRGFRREPEIERAIHERYDPLFDSNGPARRAFYIFSKNAALSARVAVIDRVLACPSAANDEPAGPRGPGHLLLRSDQVFAAGWHPLEIGPGGPYRWSGRWARIRLEGLAGQWLNLRLFTHHPEIDRCPVRVRFTDARSGREIERIALSSPDPRPVTIPVRTPDTVLDLGVEPTWVPALQSPGGSMDSRELGVGVQDAHLAREPHGQTSRPAGWAWLRDRLRGRR